MNKEDIIRLAREAGVKPLLYDGKWAVENLDVFAALVAAHERERICKQIAMLHDSLSLTGTANWGKT